jgi:hypothetical protein
MNNPWDDMRAALIAAKEVQSAADDCANTLVDILDGRLRRVAPWKLRKLKRQLQEFDAHREMWKDEK